MADRGDQHTIRLQGHVAAAGLTTLDWQEQLNGGSTGHCRELVVVADAVLYYRTELVADLTRFGCPPRSESTGDLIAAAVRSWGDDAPLHLEGDYAYVAFDTTTGRGYAARDPIGSRPLYFVHTTVGLAIASAPSALVAAGFASSALNNAWLAELCAGFVNVGSETAYRQVAALRQGERLRFGVGVTTAVDQWWSPPAFTEDGTSRVAFADAAVELRELIVSAVRERLDPQRATFVSLSGGRDSSAVYAAGRRLAGDRVRAISLSYPVGDPGREDETIREILEMCGGQPRWIDTDQLPLFRLQGTGTIRPDAFTHPYESPTAAIADSAGAEGGRIVLNGLGGDTLFHSEHSFLADLVFAGRWVDLRREWRLQGGGFDPAMFFRWGLLPRLGPVARDFVAAARGGRRLQDVWDPPVPGWIRGGDDTHATIRERAWREPVRELRADGAGDRERRLMVLGPFAGRVVPEYSRVSLSRGIEQRSPLYDSRIISFAATRPRAERQRGGDYKRLLRAAMEPWLPVSVTGPRLNPTGFSGGYFRRLAMAELPQLIGTQRDKLIADEAGLIVAKKYRAELHRFTESGEHGQLPALVFTALVESWLRSQSADSDRR